ncbi:Radical SAM domain protein [Methanolacinia petrolearia DSM 11571]|uniref:Radical SAM domain protein n=1 Tax=Methanolacinia petrolearia (strain DSM 11571 / OCM 486 / SEBR 4847) TaxID=679926 RepID=E1RF34_METP4|nr:radical SAM protein [Methanolacinia petrolearia]ADN37278.1 Radical SAM domain protein [Methanolacinia petrolearia DSM 11571]
MKASCYNNIIPAGPGKFVLFNSFRKTIGMIDGELKEALENNSLDKLPDDQVEELIRQGVICANPEIERLSCRHMYNSLKYSNTYSAFTIFPTYNCNLSCPYCYQKELRTGDTSMDRTSVEKTIRFIKNTTLENKSSSLLVKFFGGEPLTEPEICIQISKELREWAKAHNIKYIGTLTTNGTLLSGENFDRLSPYISACHITLDGPREIHDKKRFYRGGKGTYDDIINAASAIAGAGKILTLRVNFEEENLPRLRDLMTDLASAGMKDCENLIFDFGLVHPPEIPMDDYNNYLGNKRRFLSLLQDLRAVIAETGWSDRARFTLYDDVNGDFQPFCESLKICNYVIDPFCDLYLCPSTSLDERYRTGRINDKGIAEWNNRYYELKLRDPLEYEECSECLHFPVCGGGCPVHAYNEKGLFNVPCCGSSEEFVPLRVLSYLKRNHPEKMRGSEI